jgi:arabinose operon protein AraL
VVFVTNKPIASQEEYHHKLTKFGFDVTVNQIINSSYATAIFLTKYAKPADQVFVVGEQPLIDELNQANIQMTDNPLEAEYVVVSWDRQFTYEKLNNMYQAWKNGAKFVATNPDRTCPVDGGEVPDCGSIMGAFTAASGHEITEIGGKPSRLMADLVLDEVLKMDANDCYMIGDRLETDILMGNNANLTTILVLSGVTTEEMAKVSTIKSTYTLPSVKELPDFIEGTAIRSENIK